MMRSVVTIFVGLILFGLSACQSDPLITAAPSPGLREPTTPANLQAATFEAMWEAVDEYYIYGDETAEAWQAVYTSTLSRVRTSPAEAFPEIIATAIEELPEGAALWQSRAERIRSDRENPAYDGIGAYISYRAEPMPRILLLAIVPDSPAEEAGLSAHETIVAVDEVPILPQEGIQAVERIRGEVGTQVNMTIRGPEGGIREVTVTRDRLTAVATLQGGLIRGQNVGYFLFPPSVYADMERDLVANLQIFTEGGTRSLDGLILDFRVARSSGAWPIDVFLTLFADGALGTFITRAGSESYSVTGTDFLDSQSVPLVVLVGPDTEGTPEVFAAILQSLDRAVVVGLPTPGLVEQAREFPLPDGSRVFIAASSFETLDGVDVGKTGVVPDIRIEADWDEITPGLDPVLNTAVGLILE